MRVVDFILEQDINTTSVYDIEMEQLIAEMEVYTAIINECEKQNMILEYADDSSVFLEDGEDTEGDEGDDEGEGKKKKGFFKKKDKKKKNDDKGDAAKKKWWQSVKDFFVKIGKFIYDLFTKTDYEKLRDKVEAAPDDTVYMVPGVTSDVAEQWEHNIEDYTKLIRLVKDGAITIPIGELRAMKDRILSRAGTLTRSVEADGKDRYKYTKEDMITLLGMLQTLKTKDAVKKIGPMLKAINVSKSDLKSEANSPELYTLVKDCAKLLYTTSNHLSSEVLTMVKSIVKNQTPKKNKNKGSDGDNGGDE